MCVLLALVAMDDGPVGVFVGGLWRSRGKEWWDGDSPVILFVAVFDNLSHNNSISVISCW